MLKRSMVIALSIWVLSGLVLVHSFAFFHLTNEDAWICIRYTVNLANGFGFVSDPAGQTQLGFSNLLWIVFPAAVNWLTGLDIVYLVKIVGALSVPALCLVALLLLRLLDRQVISAGQGEKRAIPSPSWSWPLLVGAITAFLGIGLSGYLSYWATQGLETTFYALIVMATAYTLLRGLFNGNYKLIFLAFILAFVSWTVRPEGLLNLGVTVGAIAFYAFVFRVRDRSFYLVVASAIAVSAGLMAAILVFNLLYFGDFRSNPQLIKLTLAVWHEPWPYLFTYIENKGWEFWLVFLLALFGFPALMLTPVARRMDRRRALLYFVVVCGFMFSQLGMLVVSKGDYLPYSRFIVTHYPMMVLLIASSIMLSLHAAGDRLRLLTSTVAAVAILGVTWSAVAREQIPAPRWNEVGFMSPYVWAERSYNAYIAKLVVDEISKAERKIYATSEHGYIPYAVNEQIDALGLDMLGLNQKEIARTFKHYPLFQAFFANRDWILARRPELITTHSIHRQPTGEIELFPAVGWFGAPYFQSQFFRDHYTWSIPLAGEAAWAVFRYKGTYRATSAIRLDTLAEHADKLMHGIRSPGIEPVTAGISQPQLEALATSPAVSEYMEVADVARILLRPEVDTRFVCLRGFGDSVASSDGGLVRVSVALDDKTVGDRVIGEILVRPDSVFAKCLPLPQEYAEQSTEMLVSLFASAQAGEPMYRFLDGSISYRAYYLSEIFFAPKDEYAG